MYSILTDFLTKVMKFQIEEIVEPSSAKKLKVDATLNVHSVVICTCFYILWEDRKKVVSKPTINNVIENEQQISEELVKER